MFKAEDMTGYKICEKGDLVVNTLWAFMGALGVSKYHGIVSPDYHVYCPNKEVDPAYLDMMCRSTPFKVEILRHSKGVWSSRLRLKPNEFFNLCFPMPPKQEQIRLEAEISSRSSGGFSIRSELMKSIELLNERRSALITAAVIGQIPLEKMAS
jgi:type I restriction enzyme S subunit